MEIIVLSILLVLVGLLHIYTYKKGKIDGRNDFLKGMLAAGFSNRLNGFVVQNKYVKPGGIVFVGDSLTQNYNVYEHFKNENVYNRGIGGDTTEGLLTRMDASVFDLKPSKVVLLIGTNDLALLKTTPQKIYENIEEIVKRIQERLPACVIYLQSLYPVNVELSSITVLPRTNEDINEINQYLRKISNVNYIDMNKVLSKSGKLNPLYSSEGLHINEVGYEVITETLKTVLK